MKSVARFLCLSILCLCVCAAGAHAETLRFETRDIGLQDYVETVYNENNGMATSEANTILQDSEGYVWIGSYGGLYRYTSSEFQNMSQLREGAPRNGIRVLFEDALGRIFIGTNDSGIYLFDDETFTFIEAAEGASFAAQALSVRSIEQGSDGTVYIGTTSGLFSVDDTLRLTKIDDERIDGATIENLMCDQNGVIWGTTSGSALFFLQDGEITAVLGRDDFGASLAYGLMQAGDGSILIGTMDGDILRMRLTDERYTKDSLSIDLIALDAGETVNDLYCDSNRKLWVCTDNGVGYVDESAIYHRLHGVSTSTIISAMCEDYEGNLWFASSRRGVLKLTLNKFKHFAYEIGISSQTVNATLPCGGDLYIATDSGLTIMDAAQNRVDNALTRMLSGIRVRNLMLDAEGNVWIATYATYGLVRYDPKTEEIASYTTEQGMAHDQIRATLQLADGSVAAATNGGVSILRDGEVARNYTSDDGIQNETILCLAQGKDANILYAGSDGNGIYVIDLASGQVRNLTTDDGLQSGVILRMAYDAQTDSLFISNGSEAALLQDDEIAQLANIDEGVGSIFDIKLTDDYIWLLKSFGIIQITREDYIAGNPEYRVLTRRDGLTSSITANSWNALSGDGTLYVCTGDGVYTINLMEIHRNTIPPKIAVNSVEVDGVVSYGVTRLDLPADARRVTLRMSLLSFGIESGTLEYSLEGFEDGETVTTNSIPASVSYTNLPGGDYTLHLRGYNADGTGSRPLTLPIHKERSFFERQYLYVWLIMAVLLLVLLLIVVAQFIGRKRSQKRAREYKAIADQTVRIVSKTIDAKDKYTIGHSHRVAAYAVEIGRRYGLSPEELEQLHYGGLLHDIGKIGISDRILNKKGKLTDEEYAEIKRHPAIGGDILKEFTMMPRIQDAAKYHHERYDGTGYNEGLKGEQIPLYARIISVADAYDAMNSTRVYRPSMTQDVIYNELEKGKGTQFDPAFAQIMMDMIRDGFTANPPD